MRLNQAFITSLLSSIVVFFMTSTQLDAAGSVDSQTLRDAVELDNVRAHQAALQAVADANGGNRASGTPGYDDSSAYVVSRLEAAGYSVHVQNFGVPHFEELVPAEFEQLAPNPQVYPYFDGSGFATMNYSGSGDVTGLVQAVDLMIPPAPDVGTSTSGCEESDFAGFTFGNVALIQRGACSFQTKAMNAEAAGASAVIIFNEGQPGRTAAFLGTLGEPSVNIPVIGASYAIGEDLYTLSLGTGVTVRVFVDAFSGFRNTRNVIAQIGGLQDRVVMAGANLDSVAGGPGINDNGSGAAALLEIAIQMAALDVKPRNTVRFAWWGGEEFGLLGSNHYLSGLTVEAAKKITAYLDLKMVGSPNFVRFVFDGDESEYASGAPEGSAGIEQIINDYFADQGLPVESAPFMPRHSYTTFMNAGIPSGGLFGGDVEIKTPEQVAIFGGSAGDQLDPCWHLACDTFDNVSLAFLDTSSDAAAHTILTLGMTSTTQPKGRRTLPTCEEMGYDFSIKADPLGCRQSPNYWSKNPSAWPVGADPITVGGVSYTKSQAIAVMTTKGKNDKTYALFNEQIAAKLNLLDCGQNGGDITPMIAAADVWLAVNPPGSSVHSRDPAWDAGSVLFSALSTFNGGAFQSGSFSYDGLATVEILTDDGIYFDWTSTRSVDAVIVKGGRDANVYEYDPESYGDFDLHAPINRKTEEPYSLSYVEFCFDYDIDIYVHKFHDLDEDGEWDAGEPEIGVDQFVMPDGSIGGSSGWPYLFTYPTDSGTSSDVSRTPGTHQHSEAGTYSIKEFVLRSWEQTAVYLDGSQINPLTDRVEIPYSGLSDESHDVLFGNTGYARLTLVKHVINDHGGTAVASDWTLHAGSESVTGSEAGELVFLQPGTYGLSETAITGYANTSLTCDDNPGVEVTSVTLATSDDIICTFVNDDIAPTLQLIKTVINDDGGTLVQTDFPSFVDGSPQAWDAVVDQSAGAHTASETPQFGYAASNWGGDCAADGSITLALAQNAVCTITNDDIAPTLQLLKTVVNDNGGTLVQSDFPSFVDGSPQAWDVVADHSAGAHTASETPQAGYSAGDWGGDCAADGSITLALAQNAVCTITNDDDAPSLRLIKHVSNDDGGTAVASDWTLHAGGNSVAGSESPQEVTDQVGTYALSETGGPDGYRQTSLTCDNAAGQVTEVTLGLGETVTCTFVNDDIAPTLQLIKTVINDNGGTLVQTDFPSFVDGSPQAWDAVVDQSVGAHTASETPQFGYAASNWGGDCAADGSITLALAQNAVCTITNDDIAPTLQLLKTVVNDNGGTLVQSDFPSFVDGSPQAWDVVAAHNAGTNTASETPQAGYSAGDWGGDCAADGTIVMTVGNAYVCTITNDDISPTLTLIKTVINDNGGTLTQSDFPSFVDGSPQAWDVVAAHQAGWHTASETPQFGYAASNWGGDCAVDGSISLALAQNAVCTITNDDIAPTLQLLKTVVNDNGGTLVQSDFPSFVDGNPQAWDVVTVHHAGNHTASETPQAGYTPSAWGGDCAPDGTISMSVGRAYVCTITNDDVDPNQPPTAANQSYNATGNVTISVPAGAGLVSGATDPDGDVLTVNSVTNVTAGASVSENPDGSFTYSPPAGFKGTDSFNYDLTDSKATSNTATVEVTVSDMIWFVDNSLGAPGNGTQVAAFNSLPLLEASGLPGVGDCIFIDETSSGAYSGPLTLDNNQILVGKGSSVSIDSACGITLAGFSETLPATGGARPEITSTVNGINLASGNSVRGLNIGNTSGTGLSGNSVGASSVNQVSITGTGAGVDITTGTLTMSFDEISSSDAAGIDLSGVSGNFDVTTGTISSGSTNAVSIAGSPIDLDVSLTSVSVNGAVNGINIDGTTGNFTVTGSGGTCSSAGTCTGGSILNTTGDGISLTLTTNITLNKMFVDNTGRHGVFGADVLNLAVNDSIFEDIGNADNEDAFSFKTETGGTDNNISGTLTLNNVDITRFYESGLHIYNETGTLVANVTNSYFNNNDDTANLSYGVYVELEGNADATLDVSGTTFENVESDIVRFETGSSVSNTVNILNNTSTEGGGPDNFPNGGGIHVITDGGDVVFDIRGNSLQNLPGDPIVIASTGGGGDVEGRIGGANVSDGNEMWNDPASVVGDGITLSGNDSFAVSPNWTVLIQNNFVGQNSSGSTITGMGDDGIFVLLGDNNGVYNITVEDNTIRSVGALAGEGIDFFVDEDGNDAVPPPVGFARIVDNTIISVGDFEQAIEIDTGEIFDGCFHIDGNSGAVNVLPGEIDLDQNQTSILEITQASTAALSTDNNGSTVTTGGTITFNGTCTNPTLPSL